VVLLAILGTGGALFGGYRWFYKPLEDYNRAILKLKREVRDKESEVKATRDEIKLLDRARLMSLSPNLETAKDEYGAVLDRILYNSGLEIDNFAPVEIVEVKSSQQQNTVKPAHRFVTYQVKARGDMAQLVSALQGIKVTPLVHRIRSLDITRQDAAKGTSDKLMISMRVEAMIVGRADPHVDGPLAPDQRLVVMETILALRRGPTGLGLLPWIVGPTGPFAKQVLAMESGYRQYGDMAQKNIFRGGVPPEREEGPEEDPQWDFDVLDYVRLDTADPDNGEAFLRNLVFNIRPTKLRTSSWSGFNTFRIYSGELRSHVLVTGKVLKIEQRDVYFQVLDEIYSIHLGQTLHDAMWRPVSDSVLDRLKLKIDETWAEQQKKEHEAQVAVMKTKKKKGPGR
jgi:hypothetical protein